MATLTVKCRIVSQYFPNPKTDKLNDTDYRIFKAEPLQVYESLVTDKNLQFSIKGNLSYLFVDEDYELVLKFIEKNQYGASYAVVECLSYYDLSNLTREDSEKILNKIASSANVKTLLDTYPDFINTILTTDWKETIDTSKLFNIKDGKMGSYARQLNERYKYYSIMVKYKEYGFTIKECRKLADMYKTIMDIDKAILSNPYYVLVVVLGRRFMHDVSNKQKSDSADVIICKNRKDLIDSDVRCEYLMMEVLKRNEQGVRGVFKGGSTRLQASAMFQYCKDYAPNLCPRMPKVAKECEGIYYEEDTGYMSVMATYMMEVKIAKFIKNLAENNEVLDLDWQKYTTVKDGTLTTEQSNVLKDACENRIIIVDAGAGNGKSSSMMAMLHMFDDYKITYRCMTSTGKSAKRFEEASGRSCHTIHRDTLNGDIAEQVIIIDEDSLLSTELICMVINAITNPNVRIVFLGDIQQLLNLSLGTPIKDLIESGLVKVSLLTKCFRFGLGGKATVSTKCRNGQMYIEDDDYDKEYVSYGKDKDYSYTRFNHTQEQILDLYVSLLKKYKCKPKDLWGIVPYNVGQYGCLELNNKVQAIINPPVVGENTVKVVRQKVEIVFRKGDMVMNNVNNYNCISLDSYEMIMKNDDISRDDMPKEECMNGMSGKVLDIKNNVMMIQFDEKILVFSKSDAEALTLSYFINHFKAQGSQINHVLLLTIAEHEALLNKQCLYTGLTRATLTVDELADIRTIENAVNRNDTNSRDTFLPTLLKESP